MINMRNLEVDKIIHAQRHKLGPTDNLPQDIDFYREQVKQFNKGPFYVCPAGGEYTVGQQDEEPACSVHGTLSEIKKSLEFMYKEKRLPESRD